MSKQKFVCSSSPDKPQRNILPTGKSKALTPVKGGSERSFKHSPLPDESLLEELGLSRAKRGDG